MIRDATPDDMHAIAKVHLEARSAGYGRFLDPAYIAAVTLQDLITHWRTLLTQTDRRTVVAEDKGELVGFVHFGSPSDGPKPSELAGILAFIFVQPRYWGSSVGMLLLGAAEDGLASQGFTSAFLGVYEKNERARAFYERHGWRHDGERWQVDRGSGPLTQMRYVKAL